jgi:CRP-like cAMP-binding protein
MSFSLFSPSDKKKKMFHIFRRKRSTSQATLSCSRHYTVVLQRMITPLVRVRNTTSSQRRDALHPVAFLCELKQRNNHARPNNKPLAFRPHARIAGTLDESLYARETPVHAFFMTSGMASVVTSMEDGGIAEVGVIGLEGLVGGFHLLGPSKNSTNCFIQLQGTALRITLRDLKNAFRDSEDIRDRVLEFVQFNSLTVSQIAGCNRLHEAEERLARWLLMAQDRTQSDDMYFTQEFLAMMVGARRTTVTLIAGALQRADLIEYSRGRVKILDRERLETAACDCYRICRDLFTNLYKYPAQTF